MFTDMVGYQDVLRQDESLAKYLLEKHRSVIREALSAYGGKDAGGSLAADEETGLKGWLTGGGRTLATKLKSQESVVLFRSALDATRCAVEIQQRLREYNREAPSNKDIYLSIGIHVGEVTESGGDIRGDAVNISSRIQPLAEPGEICISQQVYDQVRNKVTLQFVKLDTKQGKNADQPIDAYRIVMPWEIGRSEEQVELDRRRIAVLPLKNMSPDPNDEYFADGMTEELITTLSGVSELTVIARTSVMQYKISPKRIAEIGRELRTGTVIEGSVRKAANKLRITVQVVDSVSEGHIWAQNYDRQVDDVFAIQSEIAEKVAEALKVKLIDSDMRKLEARPTANVGAYLLYLKGRYYWNERSKQGLRKAVEYFQQAVENDPNFALGFSGLADCYYILAHNSLEEPAPALAKAKGFLAKALALDDRLAEAHATLAAILFDTDYDVGAAESEFKRSIELKPNYATAHQWYALRLNILGRSEEAYVEFKKALDLDPLSPIINVNFGDYFYYTRQYDRAIGQYAKTIERFPDFAPAHMMQAACYAAKSMFPEAFQAIEEYSKTETGELEIKLLRAFTFAWMRNAKEARQLLAEFESRSVSEFVGTYTIALVHFVLGEDREGFAWLEKAFQKHDPQLKFIVLDRELDNVRQDERYVSILRRIGLSDTAPH